MQPIQQQFSVPFSYAVHFTEGLFDLDNPLLAEVARSGDEPGPSLLLVVIDDGLLAAQPDLPDRIASYAAHRRDALTLGGAPVIVPGGEAAKNDAALVERLHRAIYEAGLCRHSYVLAVGGGAVLDLAGYAAATAHRGIRLLRVPTTVLSQNDSAVGVKNSINAWGVKNFLGTFAPPYAVLNDFGFLKTLDDRDWRAGIAEAVKVALLKDAAFFSFIADQAGSLAPPRRDAASMKRLIYRCAQLHLNHIATSGDPFEMGTSRPLDFGHWAAHKLEFLTDYQLRHGEAVAIGIALDCTYAHLAGMLGTAAWEQVLALLEAVGFRLFVSEMAAYLDAPDHPRCLFRGLEEFREHLGGRLTIMLLEDIGQGVEVHAVDETRYRQAVAVLQTRQRVLEHAA